VHDALFYEGADEYVDALRSFAREGLAACEPTLFAVPQANLVLLRSALSEFDGSVEYVDMREQGRNPARILPLIHGFIQKNADRPVRFVNEPIWAGRSIPEIVEGHRHEALINAAFAEAPARILCPYDVRGLAADVIDAARRTHPAMLVGGERHTCKGYVDPLVVYDAEDSPLCEPPSEPLLVPFVDGLGSFRRTLRFEATAAGMTEERIATFVIAANEAAANTICHAEGDGIARLWREDHTLVCELADSGRIVDPFVGRTAPPPDGTRGRGLWLMNQMCDLVELRSGSEGTVVRIHMHLA
jgi:anti-sigma regulatory factor (Ser/Thr protein kinase)